MTNRDHNPSISQNDGGDAKSRLKPSEVLSRAADLIEREGAWTRGAWSRVHGLPSYPGDHRADCWCATGAIHREHYKVRGTYPAEPLRYAAMAIGHRTRTTAAHGYSDYAAIEAFNDAHGRTQDEVVAALRGGAELARRDGQ